MELIKLISRQKKFFINIYKYLEKGGLHIRKGAKVDCTLIGEKLFSLIVKKTKDGFLFIVPHPKLHDVHLIAAEKNGTFFCHITDNREGVKNRHPFKKEYPSEEVGERAQKIIRKYVKKYHGNRKAWIMTSYLRKRFNEEITKLGLTDTIYPLELSRIKAKGDFNNKKRWKRVRIKDMISLREPIGYIQDKNIVRMVHPLPFREQEAVFISNRQLVLLLNRIFKFIGFNEYGNYIGRDIKEDLISKAKEIKKNK